MSRRYILLYIVLFLIITLSGCSKGPEDVLDNYISSWKKLNYEDMYESISDQDKDGISFNQFKENYEDLYSQLNLKKIKVEKKVKSIEEKENKDKISVPITVSMSTGYGEKTYETELNLVEEEEDDKSLWKVNWDYNLIYGNLSQGDSIRTVTIAPERGKLLDRNGNKLADNNTVVQVGIVPGRLGDRKDEIVKDLAETFDLTKEYIEQRLSLSWVTDETFVDIVRIPVEKISLIEKIHDKNAGATYKEIKERVYPYRDIAAHLIGYLGYADAEEVKELEKKGFTSDDKFGRTGLEKIYDEKLRGNPGKKVIITNDRNVEKEVIFEEEVQNGKDINLTIDIDLQKNLYDKMHKEKGTASVLNYKTGEVLALISTPSYDPNKFILGINEEELTELQDSNSHPLLNRFTRTYSPGSVFKPITAAIALDENAIDEDFSIDISGKQWQKDKSWGNYYITRVSDPGTSVNLEKAMVYSDNIYFGQVALKIGSDTFIERARDFGIGKGLDFQYGMNKSQLANDDKISTEVLLADSGYGQGEVAVNILNIPKAYSAFVNGGKVVEPKLTLDNKDPKLTQAVSEDVAKTVFDSLIKVIEDKNGTANDARIEGKTLAGKTGTAEISNSGDSSQKDELGWFTAIDKDDVTPYITTVMIEDAQGRGGSHLAIPVVRDFIKGY